MYDVALFNLASFLCLLMYAADGCNELENLSLVLYTPFRYQIVIWLLSSQNSKLVGVAS